MKKFLSLILAVLMTVSCASFIFADGAITEEAPEGNVVVSGTGDYDHAIKFLVDKKIMQGKGEDNLAINDGVKRYEMAIFVGRISTGWVNNADWENGPEDDTDFPDLAGSGAADFYGALSYCAQKGIIVGYDDGTFRPEKQVTYREALAMAVRTLGYTGLKYPWGCIEKAVTLGLTKGISDVTYTDAISRGVAAQIIYNTLFAKTANGSTLALESFNCEYGWEKIYVVADKKSVAEAQNATTAADTVAFRLVEDDGTFGGELYYVKADYDKDASTPALQFGKFYDVFFEYDATADLADMIYVEAIGSTIVENTGNDGITNAIQNFLNGYTLVSKFTAGKDFVITQDQNDFNYIGKSYYKAGELIACVVGTSSYLSADKTPTNQKYAIDWETGDILVKNPTTNKYEVLWYYNKQFDIYFSWKGDVNVGDGSETVGIHIMTDAELEALKEEINLGFYETKTGVAYKVDTDKNHYTAPYASLEWFDLDGDNNADYATYVPYNYFAKYELVNISHCDENCQAYRFTGGTDSVYRDYIVEGSSNKHKLGGSDYTNTYTLAADSITPLNGAYVIYGVNEVTNEIKIVKEIKESNAADPDTYIAYGMVRGFNKSASTITIGNSKIPFNTNATLNGVLNVKTVNADTFYESLMNQYVKYIVLDGKIIQIDVQGAWTTAGDLLIIEDYVGINNDGNIVVEGYRTNTTDILLDTYVIGSYDGWKQGSGFFYDNYELETAFARGNIYKVLSTEKGYSKDVLHVTILDTHNVTSADFKVEFDADGYVSVNGGAWSKSNVTCIAVNTKTAADISPIRIFDGSVAGSANGAKIEGKAYNLGGNKVIFFDPVLTGVTTNSNKTAIIGFLGAKVEYNVLTFDDWADADGYYIYGLTEYTVGGAFDIVTGAAVTARGYNLKLNGNAFYYAIKGKDGYYIVDDTLDYDKNDDDEIDTDSTANAAKWSDAWTEAKKAYPGTTIYNASNIILGEVLVPKANVANTTELQKYFSGEFSDNDGVLDYIPGFKVTRYNLLDGKVTAKTLILSGDTDGYIKSADTFKDGNIGAAAKFDNVKVYFVFNTTNNNLLVYVNPNDGANNPNPVDSENTVVNGGENNGFDTALKVNGWVDDVAYITATLGENTAVTEWAEERVDSGADNATGGNIINVTKTATKWTIDEITFAFAGAVINDTHKAIANDGFYFGNAGVCTWEDWKAYVDTNRYYGSISEFTYDELKACEEDANCEIINAVKFTGLKVVVENGKEVVKTFKFTDSNGFNWTFKVVFKVVDGDLVCGFSGLGSTKNYGNNTITLERVAIAEVK